MQLDLTLIYIGYRKFLFNGTTMTWSKLETHKKLSNLYSHIQIMEILVWLRTKPIDDPSNPNTTSYSCAEEARAYSYIDRNIKYTLDEFMLRNEEFFDELLQEANWELLNREFSTKIDQKTIEGVWSKIMGRLYHYYIVQDDIYLYSYK